MRATPKPQLAATGNYLASAPGGSLSPAARVASALLLSAAIAFLPHVAKTLGFAIAALVVGCALLCRPNFKRLSLRLSLALLVIVALAVPFVISGEPGTAARLGLRALGATTIALLFTSDLSSSALASALHTLRAPISLVEVIEGLALQLDSLRGVASRIVLARKLRGARGLRGNATVLPELLVRSAERAERVDLARRLRGYDAKRRTPMTSADLPVLLISGAAALALHLLAWLS